MFEFTYTNRGTYAAVTKEGKQIMHTNKIRLWRDDDGTLKYDRRYVSSKGTIDDCPIEHTFETKQFADGRKIPHTALCVASDIRWGCCGWAANSTQIYQMIEKIKPFVEASSGSEDNE